MNIEIISGGRFIWIVAHFEIQSGGNKCSNYSMDFVISLFINWEIAYDFHIMNERMMNDKLIISMCDVCRGKP